MPPRHATPRVMTACATNSFLLSQKHTTCTSDESTGVTWKVCKSITSKSKNAQAGHAGWLFSLSATVCHNCAPPRTSHGAAGAGAWQRHKRLWPGAQLLVLNVVLRQEQRAVIGSAKWAAEGAGMLTAQRSARCRLMWAGRPFIASQSTRRTLRACTNLKSRAALPELQVHLH